jgi:hypothetical protein
MILHAYAGGTLINFVTECISTNNKHQVSNMTADPAILLSLPRRTCPVGPAKFALCNVHVRKGGDSTVVPSPVAWILPGCLQV